MIPRHPVYIISKGRWDTRLTSKALELSRTPYHIVVEPQEYDNYASVIDPKKILVLPFSNLGLGGIPARNWVWEHSISIGAKRHWILDDNIDGFYRLHNNLKIRVETPAPFCAHEDFVDRYENIGMSGLDYFMFAPRKVSMPPYRLNTRIYSCILLNNEIKHRWRGKYNEDTDLSLRILKDRWCTVLFSAFLAYKMTTMTMKGGNTEEVYKGGQDRKKFVQSLIDQHPDCVEMTWKFGRWHHNVDYSQFKVNRLKLKNGVAPQPKKDYGIELKVWDTSEEAENWVNNRGR